MIRVLVGLLIIFLFISHDLVSQETEGNKLSSYEGLHFMIGFMENESNLTDFNKQLEQKIFISSNYNAKVQVKFGINNPIEYSVSQNDVLSIEVPRGFENFESEELQNKLVELTSDFPIAVYAYSSIPRSSDSYAAIPISNWGTEYIAVSLPNDQYNKVTLDSLRDYTPRSSQLLIMSAYDDTKVTIIPSSLTRKVKQVGQSYEITLRKGQCYLVQSWQYARGMGDLTGTVIQSDKPVGVLTGHVRSALLQGFVEQPPDSKDHLVEMLMPTSAWGNTFVTAPFGTNVFHGDYFKLVSKDVNAVVEIETATGKQQLRFSGNNSVVYYGLKEPAIWRASAPVQLAQFMYRTGDTTETVYYDPSIVLIPPVEQFVNRIAFNTPDESFVYADGVKFVDHYVTLIAEEKALDNLKLDNQFVSSISDITTQKIPNTNLYWARISLASGKHNLVSTDGRFAGVLFGVGRFDSYGMTLGCSLMNPYSEDNKPPTISVIEECGKLKGTITDEISDESYGIYYAWVIEDSTKNYKWKVDTIKSDAEFITFSAEPVDVYKDGKFVIEFLDKSGNKGRYVYNYDAINLKYNKDIILPQIDYNDSLCIEIPIVNLGKRAIDYLKYTLTADSRVQLYSYPSGGVIQSGDSVRLLLCLNPKGNSDAFNGKINLDFGCNISLEINFRGELIAIELLTNDVDFGEVQLGDTACDSIYAVNNGNAPITLTELSFESIFDIDTLGIFPRILQPGDTLYIKVCFSPELRSDYNLEAVYYNEFSFTKSSFIKGRGVAPNVNSLIYDFGKLRIGTTANLSRTFLNTGNQGALLNFGQMQVQTHIDESVSSAVSSINNLPVKLMDSLQFPLEFTPTDTIPFRVNAKLLTNWRLHPDLFIDVTGQGTIPVIETKDYDFGRVKIFTNNQTEQDVIFSKGNEALTIDKVFAVSGDLDAFTFEYDKFNNSVFDTGESEKSIITFNPSRIGSHELLIGVINDAHPAYKRDTAYIKITGIAEQPDQYSVNINLENDIQYSCKFNIAKVKLTNNEKRVYLSNLTIIKNLPEFYAELVNFSPRYIEKDETIEFEIKLYTERNQTIDFDIVAEFFEIDKLSRNFVIEPVNGTILLDNFEPVTYEAGDTVKIVISGKFDAGIDTLTGFNLSLDIKSEHLLINNENISLILNNFDEKLKYNLNISKTKDKLAFYFSEDLIKIIKNATWSVELEFLGLLSGEIEGNWKVNVSSEKCYEPSQGNLKTILDSVCVFNVRHIHIDTKNSNVNIYPNPADNTLRLKFVLSEEMTDGKLDIIDNLGQVYTIADRIIAGQGISFQEFDVSKFPNGSYIMKFDSYKLKKNILFVIIR